jgi:hypothetical protein
MRVARGCSSAKATLLAEVDGHEQVHLALLGAHLGEVHVQVPDGVVLELLFSRALAVLGQRQAADAVALEQAVQGRTGPPRNAGLQRVQAIVERPWRVLAEGDSRRFLFRAEHCRGGPRAHRRVLRAGALAPLGHRFRVDAVALRYAL